MKLISWVVSVLVTVLIVCFAIANRTPVSVGLWPLADRLEIWLFVPILVAGFIGFLAGGLVAWTAQGRWRRLARERGRRIDRLNDQVRRLEAREASDTRTRDRSAALAPAAPPLQQIAGSRS